MTVIESPAFAAQTNPEQSPGLVVSAIATEPPLFAAAVIVSIATNDALSVSSLVPAVKLHVAPMPTHEPSVQLKNRCVPSGLAVIVIESPVRAAQTFATQLTGVVLSVAVTVPPGPAVAVITGSPAPRAFVPPSPT